MNQEDFAITFVSSVVRTLPMSEEAQTRGRCSHVVWSGVAVSALYSASLNRLSPLLGAFQQPPVGKFEQR